MMQTINILILIALCSSEKPWLLSKDNWKMVLNHFEPTYDAKLSMIDQKFSKISAYEKVKGNEYREEWGMLRHSETRKIFVVYGNTALHKAACSNNEESALILIGAGADTNWKNEKGWTALHYAAFFCSVEVARILLENGADINARTETLFNLLGPSNKNQNEHQYTANNGLTAREIATNKRHIKIANLLRFDLNFNQLDEGESQYLIYEAPSRNQNSKVAKLLRQRFQMLGFNPPSYGVQLIESFLPPEEKIQPQSFVQQNKNTLILLGVNGFEQMLIHLVNYLGVAGETSLTIALANFHKLHLVKIFLVLVVLANWAQFVRSPNQQPRQAVFLLILTVFILCTGLGI